MENDTAEEDDEESANEDAEDSWPSAFVLVENLAIGAAGCSEEILERTVTVMKVAREIDDPRMIFIPETYRNACLKSHGRTLVDSPGHAKALRGAV